MNRKTATFLILANSAILAFGVNHRDFARLERADAPTPVYAPVALMVDGELRGESVLATNDYWNAGWRSVVDAPPPCDSNHYAAAVGWANRDEHWLDRTYEVREPPPPPPREFSKYAISLACERRGKLDALIAFVKADPKVEWLFTQAQTFREGDVVFIQGTNAVVAAGIVTDAECRAILDESLDTANGTGAAK